MESSPRAHNVENRPQLPQSVPPSMLGAGNPVGQSALWNSNMEMQRIRSPTGMFDSYKMKSCTGVQCGAVHHGGFEHIQMTNGTCQPSLAQSRMFPAPYMQQQQQHQQICSTHEKKDHQQQTEYVMGYPVPVRTVHHQPAPPCHPHHPNQQSTMPSVPVTHMDRLIQGGSTVAVTAAQMRSMVMGQYSSASTYPPSSSASGFYPPVSNNNGLSGNMPYLEYGHHNHPGHGHVAHGMSAAAAAVVQYAQHAQHQQRVATAVGAYRPTPHHQAKVMNPSQAAAYQQAYQQYQQYMQHHGILQSHQHQNTQGVMHQRVVGFPMMANNSTQTSQQIQQQRLIPYVTRTGTGQSLPQLSNMSQQPSNHAYANPHLVPGNCLQPSQQSQLLQQQNLIDGMQKSTLVDCGKVGCRGRSSKVEAAQIEPPKKNTTKSPIKEATVKFSSISDRTVKIKQAKSGKNRKKQPRLVVGQKKKSIGNSSSSSCLKKMKSSVTIKSSSSSMKHDKSMEETAAAKRRKSVKDSVTPPLVNDNPSTPPCTDRCACGCWIVPVSLCGNERVNSYCTVKPPPGFEHLMRPSFPIENYDPTLLGNLMGGQLRQEAVSLIGGVRVGDLKTLIMLDESSEDDGSGDCILSQQHTNKHSSSETQDINQEGDDEWDCLNKGIRIALDNWTEELELRKKVRRVLCRMNLNTLFMKSCLMSEVNLDEDSDESSNSNSDIFAPCQERNLFKIVQEQSQRA